MRKEQKGEESTKVRTSDRPRERSAPLDEEAAVESDGRGDELAGRAVVLVRGDEGVEVAADVGEDKARDWEGVSSARAGRKKVKAASEERWMSR